MPWKTGYTISDEQAMSDDDVRWPKGARCYFGVTVDLAPASGPGGITPEDLKSSASYYQMHSGLDAVRSILQKHRLRATIAVPGYIAALYPDVIASLRDEGHEIAAHGLAHEDVSTLSYDDELSRLQQTTALVAEAAGERPTGWFSLSRPGDKFAVGAISPNTVDLLLNEGYNYLGNSPADDRPHYWVSDPDTSRSILAMPYYYHFDDQFFLMFPARGTGLENGDALERNWLAELAAQYRRGLSFNMTVHPRSIAWPNRMQMFDRVLSHAATLPALWNATARDCADYWSTTYPASSTLHLEPSIWTSYPDSIE
nr:polysaccharide deacetylase family protein [Rhodococcus sp. (in: high G+C Gram-positive bacteria)]